MDMVEHKRDMRRNPAGRQYTVVEMSERHHEIVRLLLLGLENTRIADLVGVTPQTVSNVKNSPIVKQKLNIMRGARDADTMDLAQEIQELAVAAFMVHKDIINKEGCGEEASLVLRAKYADKILDRAGFTPIQKQAHVHKYVTEEVLSKIKQRAIEQGVIEGEYTEEVDE